MKHAVINYQQAIMFYNHKAFYKACLVDGKSVSDLLKSMTFNMHHIASIADDGAVVAVTAYKPLGEGFVEVHTFVLPEYKTLSTELLKCHIEHLKRCGYSCLKTYTTSHHMPVKNFLIKRLGFHQISSRESDLTIGGDKLEVFELIKKVSSDENN